MLIISFLDPRVAGLPVVTVGLKGLPNEDQLYDHISEALQKAEGDLITIDLGLPGQRIKLPNVFFTALSETKDSVIVPPPPPGSRGPGGILPGPGPVFIPPN